VAQVIEHRLSKDEALSSNSSTAKKKKKEEEKVNPKMSIFYNA
jgi:hypothetical protein